ncbi:hypothetical protein PCE1_004460 [Barthelona sp. PCE]
MKIGIVSLSPKPNAMSDSYALLQQFLDKLPGEHELNHFKISDMGLPIWSGEVLMEMFNPEAEEHPNKDAFHKLIDDITSNDLVLISSPIHNYGVSIFGKIFVDAMVIAGKSFAYTSEGPSGLIKTGTKFIIFGSSGGDFTGPLAAYDMNVPYLKGTLSFIGLEFLDSFYLPNTASTRLGEASRTAAMEKVADYALNFSL